MKKFILFSATIAVAFVLFMSSHAFAFHRTLGVITNKRHASTVTQLLFTTRNGKQVQVIVFNDGIVLMRYFQVIKQKPDGKNSYTNIFSNTTASFLASITPDKKWTIFMTHNINSNGIRYTCFKNKQIAIKYTQPTALVVINPLKNDNATGHFTSPKIQLMNIKFNYIQPTATNSYSKLIYFDGYDKKIKKYAIEFHAVDGLSYALLALRGNKFDNIFIVSKKNKKIHLIDLFSSHYGKKNFYNILYGKNNKEIIFLYPLHKNGIVFGTLHNTITYSFSQN